MFRTTLALKMPTTRSSGRLLVSASQASTRADADSTTKRKASTSPKKTGIKKSRSNDSRATEAIRAANSLPPSRANSNAELALQKVSVALPAVLPFSFQEAKEHLISADDRFQDLFDRLACKPFEHLEQVHPFR
jgi:DNA-3-methyladenine glycosylase II